MQSLYRLQIKQIELLTTTLTLHIVDYTTMKYMYALIKSVVIKYKGWLVTLCLGLGFSMLTNYSTVRQISTNYLRDLINRQEVASITTVKNSLSIRDRYTAEITLTPAALRRYKQQGVTLSSLGPHFSTFAGSSRQEVDQWETNLKEENRQPLPIKKGY